MIAEDLAPLLDLPDCPSDPDHRRDLAGAALGSARPGGDFASGDRTALELPREQEALARAVVAAQPRTVVVLMGGGAILCETWRRKVPAILLLWRYPGQQGGEALADVLLGRVSPSGRMPLTVPTAHGHLPPFDPRARRITYDLWHGYRRLRRESHRAAFPFGFGLSYTDFHHGEPPAELVGGRDGPAAVRVAVSVANTGSMAAAEVVQVYVEPPGRAVERPGRFLVGFRRLDLEPGGSERVVVARHAEDPGIGVDLDLQALNLGP